MYDADVGAIDRRSRDPNVDRRGAMLGERRCEGERRHSEAAREIVTHLCPNCETRGRLVPLGEVEHLAERIDPGEIVPAGECRECGALVPEPRVGGIETPANEIPHMRGHMLTEAYDDLPVATCPLCKAPADYEVQAVTEMGGAGQLTAHGWHVWSGSVAVCRNPECEHTGLIGEFLPTMVTVHNNDGSDHRMTLQKALADAQGAMEDDYANKRWGVIYRQDANDDGEEIPVLIRVFAEEIV